MNESRRLIRGVEFWFVGPEDPLTLRGDVRFDQGKMVLSIPRQAESEYPYVIEGRRDRRSHWYAGWNTHRVDPVVTVSASWGEVAPGRFVGEWCEAGEEYLFRFAIED